MRFVRPPCAAALLALGLLAHPDMAAARIVKANCTGMIDLNVYTFDTDKPTQDVAQIGEADFAMDADFIVLTGAFGEYRFDLDAGTLYHNGKDTGLYCTYSGLEK